MKRPTFFKLSDRQLTLMVGVLCMMVAFTITSEINPDDPYFAKYTECKPIYDNFNSTKWYEGVPGVDGYTDNEMREILQCYELREEVGA